MLAWLLGSSASRARASAADPAVATLLYAPYHRVTPSLLSAWLDMAEELGGEGRAVAFETLDRSRARDDDDREASEARSRAYRCLLRAIAR